VDVTSEAGLDFVHVLVDGEMNNIVESLGSGAAFIDHDGDGFLDIYLVQSGWVAGVVESKPPRKPPGNRLYRNRGDGTFEDVTKRAGVGDTGFGLAAVVADYDGDGFQDLYVCNMGPNRLYRNRGDGTFEDVTKHAGVGDPRLSVGASFLDYDGDSRLDLFVANYLEFVPEESRSRTPEFYSPPLAYAAQPDALLRNRGDGTFEDVSRRAGIDRTAGRSMTVLTADFDGDGRTDIFVTNDASANFLWRNTGSGTFEEVALPWGVAFGEHGEATASMTADWGDYDRDGHLDLLVTDITQGSVFRRIGPGLFNDEAVRSGVAALCCPHVAWGGGFLDFDNDADLDLLVVNGGLYRVEDQKDLLLQNDGAGKFTDAGRVSAYFSGKRMGRGCAMADYDNDGDLDILITHMMDRPVLLRNDSPRQNAWITLTLEGAGGNRGGLGARVLLHLGDRTLVGEVRCPTSYLCSGDPRIHFGLDGCERVERLEVKWPSGRRQVLHQVAARKHMTLHGSR